MLFCFFRSMCGRVSGCIKEAFPFKSLKSKWRSSEIKEVIKVLYRRLFHLMPSNLVSWVWTNAVQFSVQKCHKDRNSGRSVTCQCLFLLRLFSQVVSIMFLIKFSQFVHFCGIKGGYNFFFRYFRYLQRLTTPQLHRSAAAHGVYWVYVIASCQILVLFFGAPWH